MGLVLNEVHYENYNNRYGDDGVHELLQWNDVDGEIQEFREKFIDSVITDTEITDRPMLKWLETLTLHSYDERPEEKAKNYDEKTQENDADDE